MAIKLAPLAPRVDKQALADLRAQIDQVDCALHDLLRERAEIIESVRKIKGKQHVYIRPGREAQMLRALTGRPQGKIPEGLVVRIWREMISAFTIQEGAFKVAVYAPPKGPDLWDCARDHFGVYTPLVEAQTAQDAIKMLKAEKVTLAAVPFPTEGEKDAWWPLLAADKTNIYNIIATFPFEAQKAGRLNARNALPGGLVVTKLYPELTGDDRSFLALHSVHVPEAEMKRLLAKAGYKVRQMIMQTQGRGASAVSYVLAEVEGYVGRTDTRLGRLRAMMGSRLQHLMPMGGYAVPLKSSRR